MYKKRFIFIFIIFSYTAAAEKFALLPTISGPGLRRQRIEFRTYLKKIINDNAQFTTVDDKQMAQLFASFKIKEPQHNNIYMLRCGLIAGAAKICYTEILKKNKHVSLYIKIYDCQLNDLVLIEKFTVNNNLQVIVNRIYQRIKENYLTKKQYLALLKKLRIQPVQMKTIEENGGTLKGYDLLAGHEISIPVYIRILLMAGSAAEFADFMESGYTSAYYIKYLSYVYNKPLF
ncbi:MAG TPA: hypothetical protein VKS21_03720 [Spirochaetota bacterium]|nr:hypothetical protein [Spirochaetota bacterium]